MGQVVRRHCGIAAILVATVLLLLAGVLANCSAAPVPKHPGGAALPVVRANPAPAKIAVTPQPPDRERDADLALLAAHRFDDSRDSFGYILWDLADDRAVAARNENRLFIPASIQKVPTTVAALDILGPGYRFPTTLAYTGTIAGGTLTGDIYLIGGGDPMLEPADLLGIVQSLEMRGVERVAGRFYYDPSYLASLQRIDAAQPEDAGYNPGLGALSVAFNRIRLTWHEHGADGVEARATTQSDLLMVPLDTIRVARAAREPRVWQQFVYDGWAGGGPTWLLTPHMPSEGRAWLPVKAPNRHTANVFRKVAEMRNITLPRPAIGRTPPRAHILYRHESEPLSKIVAETLKYSNNMAAETIGMVAARKLAGPPASLEQSSAVLTRWLEHRLPDGPWTGYHAENGSGLSVDARASPAQIAWILRYAWGRDYGGFGYRNLLESDERLAVMAEDLAPEAIPLEFRSKSGTLYYSRGLAGYIVTRKNRPLAFSVFLTDLPARHAYDADPDRRSPEVRRRARDWVRRARKVELALVERWLRTY